MTHTKMIFNQSYPRTGVEKEKDRGWGGTRQRLRRRDKTYIVYK